MRKEHRTYLAGTVAALALTLPGASIAGGAAEPMVEPVVITPVAVAPAPAPWTGFYAGLGVGYGRGASSTGISTITNSGDPLSFNPSVSGFLGSARLGYDIQRDNFVFGALIEGSFGTISGTDTAIITLPPLMFSDELFEVLSDQARKPEFDSFPPCTIGNASFCPSDLFYENGETNGTSQPPQTITLNAKASYSNLMSIALRAGGLVNDGNTLLYGRLGASRAKLTATLPGNLGTVSSTGTGINAGLGVEHRLNRNVSVFAEYNYHDVGKTFTTNVAGADWTVTGKGLHTISAGVNFRF